MRESAEAKCVMKSYVDAGNDLMTAEDLYHALHFGKGIQNNAQVAVVAINQKETVLNGTPTIPKIGQYHSFEFFSTYIMMWRYFGIGKGKRWDYSNVTFLPIIDIIYPTVPQAKMKQIRHQ